MPLSFDLLTSYLRTGQLLRRVRKSVIRGMYITATAELDKSVIIAGSGRSGTTWLSEIVNFNNEYRFIFEPIRPEVLPSLRHFCPKQYLRPDNHEEKYLQPIDDILHGRIRNAYLDKHNMRFFARRVLIKVIRGHLLLRWLHNNFPMIPIIFVLRHPCAVAMSKQRLGWDTEELEGLLAQCNLVEDFLEPYRGEMSAVRSAFERHVLIWCIENFVVLKQFQKNQLLVTFYESLCENPETETARIFAFLGKSANAETIKMVRKPSATAIGHRVRALQRDIGAWTRQISSEDLRRCQEILTTFGFDAIYDDSPRPHVNGLNRLLT